MFTLLILVITSLVLAHSFVSNSYNGRFFTRSTVLKMNAKTPLVGNGKRFEATPGSPLIPAIAKLGMKVPVKCKKGECGTCSVSLGGKKMRACISVVPDAPRLKSLIEKGLAVKIDN